MKIFTTLNRIKLNNPCKDGWVKLLSFLGKTEADDEPLDLLTILKSNGVQDCIWAFKCTDNQDKIYRLIAADFAESVLHIYENTYPQDNRPRLAIQAARDYANGLISIEELNAARDVAWAAASAASAAMAAAWATARDVASAARAAAWDAASAAAKAAARATARDAARAATMTAARAREDAARAARDAARAVMDAAWDAARAAARAREDAAMDAASAAWAAAWARDAAMDAAWAAARDAARAREAAWDAELVRQKEILIKYLS